jgi:hypothetical protein
VEDGRAVRLRGAAIQEGSKSESPSARHLLLDGVVRDLVSHPDHIGQLFAPGQLLGHRAWTDKSTFWGSPAGVALNDKYQGLFRQAYALRDGHEVAILSAWVRVSCKRLKPPCMVAMAL